jgi:hypothetical protein
MAKNSRSGKGTGGFASAKTRRARKYAVLVKANNRARNAAAKAR